MEDNNIRGSLNNYKGVMLCSRPNEMNNLNSAKEKPFCSRVDHKDQLGLNPILPKTNQYTGPGRVNMVLKRHKDWLEVFKLKMKYKKDMQEDQQKEETEKFNKIKDLAAKDRVKTRKMKKDFDELNNKIMNELDDNKINKQPKQVKLTENNLKKLEEINKVIDNNDDYQENYNIQQKEKQEDWGEDNFVSNQGDKLNLKSSLKSSNKKQQKNKPKWAYTEQEIEAEEEQEADDLLDFVDNLNYDKYINDLEVQTLLKSIQNRVQELKEDKNWKQNAKQKLKEKRIKDQENNNDNEDNLSKASLGETRSVASERTQQSIQNLKKELKNKKEGKQNWDTSTITAEKKFSVEEKIAKLVADEVLRTYKNLGTVHSNQSIRKLLECEAGKFLQPSKTDIAQRYDGPNINVIKERSLRRNELDPNTLPYMHRNPAI